MAERQITEVVEISDFPGFYAGVSRSKLPSGALLDWGAGKGTSRTSGVHVSSMGELANFTTSTPMANVPGKNLTGMHVWEHSSGPHLFVSLPDGIARLRLVLLLSGNGYKWQLSYAAFEAFLWSSGATSVPYHRRVGRFVPFGDVLYFCDGVGYALRLDDCTLDYNQMSVSPMGMANYGLASSVVDVGLSPLVGFSDVKQSDRTYYITFVSKYGESPALSLHSSVGTPGTLAEGQTVFSVFTFNWAFLNVQYDTINVYRCLAGVPYLVAAVRRNTATFVDVRDDSELVAPLPNTLGLPPTFKDLAVHQGRMFGLTQTNRFFCSEAALPDVWPPQNEIVVSLGDRASALVALREINGECYVFTSAAILRLTGTRPEDYTLVPVSTYIGCVATRSLCPWQDGHVFLSSDGLYFFNGSRLSKLSDPVEGLLRRTSSGLRSWSEACGAVAGNTYFLSYYEADETGTIDAVGVPNRVLTVNLVNGKWGVRDQGGFYLSCPNGSAESIVAAVATTDTNLSLLSDYPTAFEDEVTSPTIFLADLDLGYPDQVKVLERVEVHYEALAEVNSQLRVFCLYPYGDPDSSPAADHTETISSVVSTDTTQARWDMAWTATHFAMFHQRRTVFNCQSCYGKAFNLSVVWQNHYGPLRIVKVVVRFHVESPGWRGTN